MKLYFISYTIMAILSMVSGLYLMDKTVYDSRSLYVCGALLFTLGIWCLILSGNHYNDL